jgi:two-component sensor histidine kinase
MALIHERLYRSDDLAHIDFGSYLKDLTGSLVQTYRQQSQHIALQVEADTVMLDIDSAIPCGLIVSELTSNALKHAFPNGRPGRIQVALRCEDSGQMCRLIVSDDGIGMPGGLDYQNTLSLGLQLVNSLTHQLSGTVAVETGPGTRFEILFPTPNGSPEAIDTAAAPAVR